LTAPAWRSYGRTETRFVSVILMSLGLGTLAFTAVFLGSVIGQAPLEQPWWWMGAFGIAFVLPVAIGVTAAFTIGPVLRAGVLVLVVGFPLALATLKPSLVEGSLDPGLGAPWVIGVTPIPAVAAALVLPGVTAWLYSLLLAVFVAADRMLAFPGSIVDVAIQDALVALLLQSVFAGLTLACVHGARIMDRTAAAVTAETVAAARERARLRERLRADALLHDTVLATLLLASRSESASVHDPAAELATRGLQQIDQSGDLSAGPTLSADEFVRRARALTTEAAPFAVFRRTGTGDLPLPAGVADTLIDAAAEALRNSVRHAGAVDVPREVVVDVGEHAVHLAVLDDGRGFDPDAIPLDRLGVRLSLVERMSGIRGGSAIIRSQPGRGTAVVLRWDAHAVS
jgi:signal transduction histidine kinase